VPADYSRLPRRRRWGLLAVGLALVVACAIAAYLLVVAAGISRPFLALTRDVPYGATITVRDLAVVNLNPAAGLQAIPASQRRAVVGKHAAAELFAGTLLTEAQLREVTIPAPGQQLIGIEAKPAQLPVRPLKPGDPVLLVVVPSAALAGVPEPQASTAAPRTSSIPATVAAASSTATNGNVKVDVAVSQADGPTVAAMAAAGRIVLVLTTRSR